MGWDDADSRGKEGRIKQRKEGKDDADSRRKELLSRKIGKVWKQQSDGKSNKLGLWKLKAYLGGGSSYPLPFLRAVQYRG